MSRVTEGHSATGDKRTLMHALVPLVEVRLGRTAEWDPAVFLDLGRAQVIVPRDVAEQLARKLTAALRHRD